MPSPLEDVAVDAEGPLWPWFGLLLAGWVIAFAVRWSTFGGLAAPTDGLVELVASLAFWAAVVAIMRSDIASYIIPDSASAAIAVLGLAEASGSPLIEGAGAADGVRAGAVALATGAAGFALFWLVSALFRRFGPRPALGFGDVKLAGACSMWLAPGDAALALELAALAGLLALVIGRCRGGSFQDAVPFGAFMAPAAWLVHVAGPLLAGANLW